MSKRSISEDWAAVFCAALLIILALAGIKPTLPSFSWKDFSDLTLIFNADAISKLSFLFIIMAGIVVVGLILRGESFRFSNLLGYLAIFLITVFANIVTGNSGVKNLGLEIVLFSLLLGLFISNVLRVPEWITPVIQTEFYIKIGLVLLGCGIIFGDILQAGALGLIQSIAVVVVVWQFSFWLCKKFGIDDELRTMLSSAVAICGVSAAIATAGAIKGDSKKLSYVISLVLITAIPMMLIMPYVAKALGLSDAVAGAWLGGTIDTTGAVVAAGTVLGEEALKYATVVKFSQNVLLGLAAFVISVYWTYSKNTQQEKPTVRVLWDRFPKFVLGFILASLLFSFVLSPETLNEVKGTLKGQQTFWFAMAFTCIGLETKFVDIFKLDNGKPAYAFLIAQFFNIVFTLAIAWLVFN
ncbi:MAG TPA: putative sulfate exporter family transporter [Ohtaekwangia sp.]